MSQKPALKSSVQTARSKAVHTIFSSSFFRPAPGRPSSFPVVMFSFSARLFFDQPFTNVLYHIPFRKSPAIFRAEAVRPAHGPLAAPPRASDRTCGARPPRLRRFRLTTSAGPLAAPPRASDRRAEHGRSEAAGAVPASQDWSAGVNEMHSCKHDASH